MPISTANSATANNRRRPFCQPGGVSHTFAVSTNWLNVHAGIMYSEVSPASDIFPVGVVCVIWLVEHNVAASSELSFAVRRQGRLSRS